MSPSAKIGLVPDAAPVSARTSLATSSLPPVLIILHRPTSTPGRIGNALRELDYPLDIRRPRFGDALPETLSAHAGAVIFGGPMSANDPDDYVRREIGPTLAGLKISPRWPNEVYHWHREGFELPACGELLAEGGDFPVQAFRFGHAFGFQFHPDVTTAMMCRWTTWGTERLGMPGAQPRHQHFAGRACYDVAERAWLKHFLDGWLNRVPGVAMAEAAE